MTGADSITGLSLCRLEVHLHKIAQARNTSQKLKNIYRKCTRRSKNEAGTGSCVGFCISSSTNIGNGDVREKEITSSKQQ